jgi:hypothetical protein
MVREVEDEVIDVREEMASSLSRPACHEPLCGKRSRNFLPKAKKMLPATVTMNRQAACSYVGYGSYHGTVFDRLS